jgi:putative colanic acid biosynthesis UDP-glucose lipid carrier transferase
MLQGDTRPIMKANIASLGCFFFLVFCLKFTLPYLYIPPTPFVYYFVLFPASLLSWRFSFLLFQKNRIRFGRCSNNIAIVGAGSTGLAFYNYIMSNPQFNYNLIGIFDDTHAGEPPHINYLGKVKECVRYARANEVSEIYCALPYQESETIMRLMREADYHMLRFRLIPDVKVNINHKFLVELFGYVPILKPRQEPLDNKANEIVKRIFDLIFSSLMIVFLLSWLIPVLTLAIKLDSKGPVFFRQLRSGKKNEPFYCLKFRSMILNRESDTLQACRNDARVTRIGRFIRKTSIDELPQFINVFLGDMSVVGPRPHMLKHTQDYSKLINNYMVRHLLTPGITGWAQIKGERGETKEPASMLNRVEADLWYLENWSIMLDLKIIFLTLWQALKRNKNVY